MTSWLSDNNGSQLFDIQGGPKNVSPKLLFISSENNDQFFKILKLLHSAGNLGLGLTFLDHPVKLTLNTYIKFCLTGPFFQFRPVPKSKVGNYCGSTFTGRITLPN